MHIIPKHFIVSQSEVIHRLSYHDMEAGDTQSLHSYLLIPREKGRDLIQSYDKRPYTRRKSKKQRDKITTKNFDYTTIADRLRTVS